MERLLSLSSARGRTSLDIIRARIVVSSLMLIIVGETPTVNAPYRVIKRLTTTYKLYCDAGYGDEIVADCGSFPLPHHNGGIPLVAVFFTLNFSSFFTFVINIKNKSIKSERNSCHGRQGEKSPRQHLLTLYGGMDRTKQEDTGLPHF